MMISAVIAVALGLTPVEENKPIAVSAGEIASRIGKYSQTVDRRGVTRVHGRDRLGQPYELTMDKSGHVEASVGDKVVTFTVTNAA